MPTYYPIWMHFPERDLLYYYEEADDKTYKLIRVLELMAPGADDPPPKVVVLSDGRYLADAGDFDMPDLQGNPGDQGSLDEWVRDHGGIPFDKILLHSPQPFNLPAPPGNNVAAAGKKKKAGKNA